MGDISEHFDRSEMECKCLCGMDTVDAELITVLEDIRRHFGQPIKINSGNRCFNYNHKIGGSPRSQHLLSKAADIVVSSIDPKAVWFYLCDIYPDKYGIGKYLSRGFTHIDVREKKARF